MKKYETPEMEITWFDKKVRTGGIIVDSTIDNGDEDKEMVGPW